MANGDAATVTTLESFDSAGLIHDRDSCVLSAHAHVQPPRSCTYAQGFLGLHVNSIAIYSWRLPMCRSAQNDGCAAQTNPTPDLTLTLAPTQPNPLGGSRSALEVGRGSIEFTCNLETLRARAIKIKRVVGLLYVVAPVAYQVILEPGIGQFREFEPRRVHTRINSLGLFLVDKLSCGKRESVS